MISCRMIFIPTWQWFCNSILLYRMAVVGPKLTSNDGQKLFNDEWCPPIIPLKSLSRRSARKVHFALSYAFDYEKVQKGRSSVRPPLYCNEATLLESFPCIGKISARPGLTMVAAAPGLPRRPGKRVTMAITALSLPSPVHSIVVRHAS